MSWLIVGIAPLSHLFGQPRWGQSSFDRQSPPAGGLPILRVLEPTA
jgi:hypothetical protein